MEFSIKTPQGFFNPKAINYATRGNGKVTLHLTGRRVVVLNGEGVTAAEGLLQIPGFHDFEIGIVNLNNVAYVELERVTPKVHFKEPGNIFTLYAERDISLMAFLLEEAAENGIPAPETEGSKAEETEKSPKKSRRG